MALEPTIKMCRAKNLIGKRMPMSFQDYKPGFLWGSFMQRKKDISLKLTSDLISMSVYSPDFFSNFNPTTIFDKWAAVEVSDFNNPPSEMETFILPSGLYAVFHYKGLSTDHSIFDYIYRTWIPNSKYTLDDRPHFEVLGDKYKNNDPSSEEEIWIPVKLKG